MNCDGVRNLLSAYLDGELSPGDLLRVEEHLRRCHCCADEVDSLRQTIALVASLEEVELPPSFQVQLHERLVALGPPLVAARRAPAAPVWQRNVRRWAMPAAAAAAALAIGLTTYNGGKLPNGLLVKSDYKVPAENTLAVNTPITESNHPGQGGQTDSPAIDPIKQTGTGNSGGNDTPDLTPASPEGNRLPGGPVVTVTHDPKTAGPETPVTPVYVQHRVSFTGLEGDADKLNLINTHFLNRVPTPNGVDLKVPSEAFDNYLALVQSWYPEVKAVVHDLDLTREILATDQRLVVVQAEIAQFQNAGKGEREAQLVEWQRQEKELQGSLENFREMLRSSTISLEFTTAIPR